MKLTFSSFVEPPKRLLLQAARPAIAITPIKNVQFTRMASSNTLERDSESVRLNDVDKILTGPDSQS